MTSSLRNEIAYGGTRYLPYVLTEQGIMMLSGLLKAILQLKLMFKLLMHLFLWENIFLAH